MANKVKLEGLRRRMAQKNIFTIKALAALVGCRRETIYFAIADPNKYPDAHKRIMEVTQ